MENLSNQKASRVANGFSKASDLAKRLSRGVLMTLFMACLLFMTGCSFLELPFGVIATLVILAIFVVVVIGFLVFSFAREAYEMHTRKPLTPEEEEELDKME